MDSRDMDRLLERCLSGDPAGHVFRAGVLEASTAAFTRARRGRARWRLAMLSAAAVLIASVSFLLGRCSVGTRALPPRPQPVVTDASETVAVPGELVAWLQAARFFGQLGMEERVALAYDRASKLVPYDSAVVSHPPGGTFVARMEPSRDNRRLAPDPMKWLPDSAVRAPYGQAPSVEKIKAIIAQSFGG